MKLAYAAILLTAFLIGPSSGAGTPADRRLRGGSASPEGDRTLVGDRDLSLIPESRGGRRLSGRVIMKPKSEEALRAMGKSESEVASMRGRANGLIRRNEVVMESAGLGFSVVRLPPGQERKFIRDIEEGGDGELFEYLEPDYIESPTYTPNDQFLSQSWQHANMQVSFMVAEKMASCTIFYFKLNEPSNNFIALTH